LGLTCEFFQEFGGVSIIAKKEKKKKTNNYEKGQKVETFENWSMMDVKQQNVKFFSHSLVVDVRGLHPKCELENEHVYLEE
jgi:hypothetical protein